MNKPITLKSLSILTFVVFFLPFMRMCSDDDLRRMEKQPVEIDNIGNEVNSQTTKFIEKGDQELLSQKRKDATQNFYIISTLALEDLELDDFFNLNNVAVWGFTVILFLSVLIFFFSFTKRYKMVSVLSIGNLMILFFSTLALCLAEIIEQFSQIKIGYYFFVLNTMTIIYFSKKLTIEKERLR